MTNDYSHGMVLAIYAFTRGFAFVLFEGPFTPHDWGVKDIREKRKNEKTIAEISKIIERYHPETLVIEDTGARTSRRTSRIRKLYRMLTHLAEAQCIDVHRFTAADIRACFDVAGASTKYEIAQAIAVQIPAFAHRLPRPRKAWMSADARQALFDAAALGMAFYSTQRQTLT